MVLPVFVKLRKERIKRKLRIKDVASQCGYHHNAIQLWETGKSNPSIKTFVDYANALGFAVVLKERGK